MIYKNIEIHNVAELIEMENDSITWLRVPSKVDKHLSDMGKRQNRGSTGVELRFILKSDEATIKIKAISDKSTTATYQVFYGTIQGGYDAHEKNKIILNEVTDIVIKKPQGMDALQKMTQLANSEFDPNVIRIIFNRGSFQIIDVIGDVEPPKANQVPSKKLLCYGSSITHGSNSYTTPNNWTSLIAHHLDMDLKNYGFAGSCLMESEMIDYLSKQEFDIATLELGINAIDWTDNDFITQRVTNTISKFASNHPTKQIYVISPFYCFEDFANKDRANNWRSIIEKACHNLNYPNVTYINGLNIIPDMTYISADFVHPNIYGVQRIANQLMEIIDKTSI